MKKIKHILGINAHWTIMNKTKFTMLLQIYANNLWDVQYATNGYRRIV